MDIPHRENLFEVSPSLNLSPADLSKVETLIKNQIFAPEAPEKTKLSSLTSLLLTMFPTEEEMHESTKLKMNLLTDRMEAKVRDLNLLSL